MTRLILTLICVTVVGLSASPTRAARLETVTGGSATLRFTIDLDQLGVAVSPLGAAQMEGSGLFVLPITYGKYRPHPPKGKVESATSGLEFSFGSVDVSLEALEFDFSKRVVRGDLSAGPIDLSTRVFNLVPCSSGKCTGSTAPDAEFGLFLRAQAADFFENVVFSDNGFDDGDQIALLHLALGSGSAVPEPGFLTLLGVALGGLAFARRLPA